MQSDTQTTRAIACSCAEYQRAHCRSDTVSDTATITASETADNSGTPPSATGAILPRNGTKQTQFRVVLAPMGDYAVEGVNRATGGSYSTAAQLL